MHILITNLGKFLCCLRTCVMHNVAGATHEIYMAGVFSSTLVRMEFLFPKLTDVLSTETPTQLAQEISFVRRTSSIFSKMDAAVADSLATYSNMIGNLTSNSPFILSTTNL